MPEELHKGQEVFEEVIDFMLADLNSDKLDSAKEDARKTLVLVIANWPMSIHIFPIKIPLLLSGRWSS